MAATALALPYLQLPSIGPVHPYGLFLLLGVVCGGIAMGRMARRYGVEVGEAIALAGVLVMSALITGHLVDVAWYRWPQGEASGAWVKMTDGHSLFGAILGVAVVTWLWTRARGLDPALHADLVAVGCLVMVTIGRIGCAVVHDHPGLRTDLPIGVDFPEGMRRSLLIEPAGSGPLRLHDLGLYELVLLVPLAVFVTRVLARRRLRAGMLAAIVALAYAALRFPLDFLRLPAREPTQLGLTCGQWGCLVMAAIALGAARRIARSGAIAPHADELGGRPGGRHKEPLPPARLS